MPKRQSNLSETSPGLTPYPLTFEVNSINYEVNGTNDSKYDAIVDFDNYPKAFYSYRINRTSSSKMKFTDDTNFQYLFGDGWIVVLLLEKE